MSGNETGPSAEQKNNAGKCPENGSKENKVRGIRGAITVSENKPEAIYAATTEILTRIIQDNALDKEDICSIFFTTTRDLNAAFPAAAARSLGLTDVALINGHEMEVPGALKMVLRVLVHVNTTKSAAELLHAYLGGAAALRPDKAGRTEKI